MKLDPKIMKYMKKEEWRVLSAVEQGMKNHSLVPLELVVSIAGTLNDDSGSKSQAHSLSQNIQDYDMEEFRKSLAHCFATS